VLIDFRRVPTAVPGVAALRALDQPNPIDPSLSRPAFRPIAFFRYGHSASLF